ncbi:MAG: R2-like ligand-binding oxidase [Balneolales bacterium]|nr:R2-like ligand-binding oxidase [Balneolales bacterium]
MTAIFSPQWMQDWKSAINSSSEYHKHGKGWKDPLILKFSSGQENLPQKGVTGFWLDLYEGKCRAIRYANPADEANTPTVLSAGFDHWKSMIESGSDPLFLLMKGTISLEKGSLLKLTGQRNAAKALLKAASDITSDNHYAEPAHSLSNILTVATVAVERTAFSTTTKGLDFDSFPMQLFQKAKQLGIWNPSDIDFSKDKEQWQAFSELEKNVLMHLTGMFVAGEEAVTLDLLPLIMTVAEEGRIEEEIFLTSFLWEEAKHTEFFARFLKEVTGGHINMQHFHGPAYKSLFYEELHEALNRLKTDKSPESQLRASVTYNLIVEGTLAETGYEAYFNMLTEQDILPGLREGIGHLKRDESRHIAFGLYFIKRLISAHPHLNDLLEQEAGRLLHKAIDVVNEIFDPHPEMPFGLDRGWYIEYASSQFSKRIAKLTS